MNEKTNSKRRGWIFILAALLVVALLGGGLLAKYASQNRKQAEMISAGFHISSNYLKDGDTVPEYNLPDWGAGVTVSLFNYELENVAQVSEMDIMYTVNVEHGTLDPDGPITNGTTIVQPDNGQYKMPAGTAKVEHVLHIIPDGTGNVVVTVKAVKPYEKVLKATLKIVSKNLPDYSFVDSGDGTALLTVKSNDYAGTVTVKWDAAKYSPDNTNELMSDWTDNGAGSIGTFTSEDNATYYLIFIKNTGTDTTAQSGTATAGTITLG